MSQQQRLRALLADRYGAGTDTAMDGLASRCGVRCHALRRRQGDWWAGREVTALVRLADRLRVSVDFLLGRALDGVVSNPGGRRNDCLRQLVLRDGVLIGGAQAVVGRVGDLRQLHDMIGRSDEAPRRRKECARVLSRLGDVRRDLGLARRSFGAMLGLHSRSVERLVASWEGDWPRDWRTLAAAATELETETDFLLGRSHPLPDIVLGGDGPRFRANPFVTAWGLSPWPNEWGIRDLRNDEAAVVLALTGVSVKEFAKSGAVPSFLAQAALLESRVLEVEETLRGRG